MFEQNLEYATLLNNVPAGLARNGNYELIPVTKFIGKTGKILNIDDTGCDTEYEPILYLIDFEEQRLWIPSSTYMGSDENNKDIFVQHLQFNNGVL